MIDGHYQAYGCQVRCNDHALAISGNLEDALRSLRFKSQSRFLWVDAICINQEDFQERSHQISLISSVYKHARRVVVWLGERSRFDQHVERWEVEGTKAESSFGAICEVVSLWLGPVVFTRSASYRIPSTTSSDDYKHYSKFKDPQGDQGHEADNAPSQGASVDMSLRNPWRLPEGAGLRATLGISRDCRCFGCHSEMEKC